MHGEQVSLILPTFAELPPSNETMLRAVDYASCFERESTPRGSGIHIQLPRVHVGFESRVQGVVHSTRGSNGNYV